MTEALHLIHANVPFQDEYPPAHLKPADWASGSEALIVLFAPYAANLADPGMRRHKVVPRGTESTMKMNLTSNAPRRGSGGSRKKTASGTSDLSRREEILQVAARCFAENGFEATVIRQISDAAGILSGSLYHHFATKDEILHELIKPYGEHLVAKYRDLARAPGSVVDIFSAMIRFAFENLPQKRDLQMILSNERKFFRRTPEFHYVISYTAEVVRIWHGVLQEGVRAGLFRAGLDIALVTPMILRFVNGSTEEFEPPGRYSVEYLEETLLDLVMDGIRGPKPVPDLDRKSGPDSNTK